MSLVVNKRGLLVGKYEKTFEDGTAGAFCQIILEDETLQSFWAPGPMMEQVGIEYDVEKYQTRGSKVYTLKVREWDGKTKYTLTDVAE